MRLVVLGSGSRGNVALLEAHREEGGLTRVLVDAGLCKTELGERLGRIRGLGSVALEDLDAVLVTHEHGDHLGCAAQLGCPVYATAGTQRARSLDASRLVRAGERLTLGGLEVLPVLLPHDAEETVGYVLSDGAVTVGILTDCGHADPEVARAYAGCDVLVLETNHDEAMLRYGPYPPSLRRRVGGRLGHLSNDEAASFLRMVCKWGPAPKLVVAAHLSQVNNRPQLAKSALDRVLGRGGRVLVASQNQASPAIVAERGIVYLDRPEERQLTFGFPAPPLHLASERAGL